MHHWLGSHYTAFASIIRFTGSGNSMIKGGGGSTLLFLFFTSTF